MSKRIIIGIIALAFILSPLMAGDVIGGFAWPAEPSDGTQGFNSPPYEAYSETLASTAHYPNGTIGLAPLDKIISIRDNGYWVVANWGNVTYAANGATVYIYDDDKLTEYAKISGLDTEKQRIEGIIASEYGIYVAISLIPGQSYPLTSEYIYAITGQSTYNRIAVYDTEAIAGLFTDQDNGRPYACVTDGQDATYIYRLTQQTTSLQYTIHDSHVFYDPTAFYSMSGNIYVGTAGGKVYVLPGGDKISLENGIITGITSHGGILYVSDMVAGQEKTHILYDIMSRSIISQTTYAEPVNNLIWSGNDLIWDGYNSLTISYGGIDQYSYPIPDESTPASPISNPLSEAGDRHIWIGGQDFLGYFIWQNYTASGDYFSPIGNTTRIIKGLTFQPTYTLTEGSNITFYVSNNAGATWIRANSTNISFSGDGTQFRWRANMSGNMYYSPWIHNVHYLLYTIDPVEIDHTEIGGYLQGNKTAYYVGDPVDMIATIDDQDNENYNWSWRWNWGDPYANSSNPNDDISDFNATHIYSRPGTYTVTVTVGDVDGNNDTLKTDIIIADRPPEAIIEASGPTGDNDQVISIKAGDTVDFSGWNSIDKDMLYNPDETITAYNWPTLGLTGANVTYTFATAGIYAVILEVIDNYGQIGTDTITIYVSTGNGPPQPYIDAPTAGQVGETITFSGLSSNDPDGDILAYHWEFGDNSNSTQAAPTHIYSRPGHYWVNLTVSDGEFNISYYHAIEITAWPPNGDWHINSHVIIDGFTINFRGNIYIESGGWLDLRNTSLYMDTPADGQFKIDVQPGGILTAKNSNIASPYRKYGEDIRLRYHYWTFGDSGAVAIHNTTIRNTWADKATNINGITVGAKASLYMYDSVLIWAKQYTISRLLIMPLANNGQITIASSTISNNGQGGFIFSNSANVLITQNTIQDSPDGIITSQPENMTISGNTIIRAWHTAISTDTAGHIRIENNTMRSVAVGMYIKGTVAVFKHNTIYGSGNNSIGIDMYTATPIYDSIISYSSVGLYAHTETNIFDTQIRRNTENYKGGAAVHSFYSLKFFISNGGQPAIGYILIYQEDTLQANMTSGADGYTNWSYVEMETYSGNNSHWWNITAQAHKGNDTIEQVLAHTPHQVVTFEFNPVGEGGTGEDGAGEGIAWIGWLVFALIWIVAILAWYYGYIRGPEYIIIAIVGLISLAWSYWYMPDNIYYTGLIASVLAGGLTWIYGGLSGRFKYIAAGIYAVGGAYSAYMAFMGDYSISDYVPLAVAGLILVIGAYMSNRYKGRPVLYWLIVGTAAIAAYLYLSEMYLYLYMAFMGGFIAILGWYMISRNTRISTGTAIVIMGLLVVAGLIAAYLMGIWTPGQIIGDIAGDAIDSLTPDWWPDLGGMV